MEWSKRFPVPGGPGEAEGVGQAEAAREGSGPRVPLGLI